MTWVSDLINYNYISMVLFTGSKYVRSFRKNNSSIDHHHVWIFKSRKLKTFHCCWKEPAIFRKLFDSKVLKFWMCCLEIHIKMSYGPLPLDLEFWVLIMKSWFMALTLNYVAQSYIILTSLISFLFSGAEPGSSWIILTLDLD